MEKAKIMVLGTFHYSNAGQHLMKNSAYDFSKYNKMEELKSLIDMLAEFKPNKILLEVPEADQEDLNREYEEYLEGGIIGEKNKGEAYMLMFPLAKKLLHNKIYAIDMPMHLNTDRMFEYIQKNRMDYIEKLKEMAVDYKGRTQDTFKNKTLADVYKMINSKEQIELIHSKYLESAGIGAGEDYCGVEYLTSWYKRNIGIFGNAQKVIQVRKNR